MTRSVEIPEEAAEAVAGHFYTMHSKIAWSQIDPHSSVALNYKRWAREALEAAALPYLAPAAPLLPVCTNCESEAWTCAGCGVIADITQAPAVPQPVDREALAKALRACICASLPRPTCPLHGDEYARADAVLAVLAGEQEQVEK